MYQFTLVRALRSCRSRRLLALTVVLIIMVGASASTVALSVCRELLWEELPYPTADQLVVISEELPGLSMPRVRLPTYRAFSGQVNSVDSACLWRLESSTVTGGGGGRAVRVGGMVASASFFQILGAVPIRGRTFDLDEELPGLRNVIVVTEGFWRNRLDGNHAVIGQTLRLDGELVTVIGVMPTSFQFPTSRNHLAFDSIPPIEYWRPLGDPNMDRPSLAEQLNNLNHSMLVRIGNNSQYGDLEVEAREILERLREQFPTDYNPATFKLTTLKSELQGRYQPAALMFVAAVLAFCCMASLNVSTLLLVQAIERRGEFAIRLALGGSQFSILAQLITEMILIIFAAAVGACILSWFGLTALVRFVPQALVQVQDAQVDFVALVLSAGFIVIGCILVVVVPYLRFTGTGSSSVDLGVVRSRQGLGASSMVKALSILLICQISLTTVLLVGAGLLTRSFLRLVGEDPGYKTENMLTLRLDIPSQEFR